MHWVVASITARVDVYVMMVGSLTDDQIRHSPDYFDGAHDQSTLKNINSNVSCPIPRQVRLFLVFSTASGGQKVRAKRSEMFFFQKTPRSHSKRPGASFTPSKSYRPGGRLLALLRRRWLLIVRTFCREQIQRKMAQQTEHMAHLQNEILLTRALSPRGVTHLQQQQYIVHGVTSYIPS